MKKAFTLIELLLVMAVISILMGILMPAFRGMQIEGYRTRSEKEMGNIQLAMESYYKNADSYPSTYYYTLSSMTGANSILSVMPQDFFKTWSLATNSFIYTYVVSNGDPAYYFLGTKAANAAFNSSYAAASRVIHQIKDDIVVSNLPIVKLR